MNLFQELIQKFRTGDILTRLVLINCGVFVFALVLDILFTLFSIGPDKAAFTAMNYPWDPFVLAFRPWSPVTALFSSWGLWHLLFNMITLYWLGGIFLRYFTTSSLRGLYIMGGIAAMLLFTGVFGVYPSEKSQDMAPSIPLCSACILALSTALAFHAPDGTETIPLLGPVKIKYIVIALALADMALLPHISIATDAAHLGAAGTGWLFNYMLHKKNKDITAPFSAAAVWVENMIEKLSDRIRKS